MAILSKQQVEDMMHATQLDAPVESHDPSHYKSDGIECIDAMRAALGKDGFTAYCRGSIIKYLWRLGKKDDPVIEAQKAEVYCRWLVETLKDEGLTK